ncbi:hypothetical protein [Kineosporia sp. A_224]|uniref:hypothetical protein n=1 Tax=Kineosporia sp. A_224 TaxID=1962180 RepID=UPI000B4B2293|nr:hypothetical protein [Kineosporia sp. A_224]
MPSDEAETRRLVRVRVDVLCEPDTVNLVTELIGQAICGKALDHDGPCRLAWQIGLDTEDDGDLTADQIEHAWGELRPVRTLPGDEARASIAASLIPEGARRAGAEPEA